MMKNQYKHISVVPVTGALGADISGVQIADVAGNREIMGEIQQAFGQHLVLFFRDQKMDTAGQERFASAISPLTKHPFIGTLPGSEYTVPLIRDADATGLNFGGEWHCDGTFVERPSKGCVLRSIDTPPWGGDTMWSNLILAYEMLSEGMKKLADSLILIHSAANAYDPDRGAQDKERSKIAQKGISHALKVTEDPKKEMEHPLVRIHHETGKKILWVPGPYALRFKGMSEQESKPLLDELHQHAIHPEFTCRFRWYDGSVAMWYNRATQHFAVNDFSGFRREMHRVMFEGERPYGPAMPMQTAQKAAA